MEFFTFSNFFEVIKLVSLIVLMREADVSIGPAKPLKAKVEGAPDEFELREIKGMIRRKMAAQSIARFAPRTGQLIKARKYYGNGITFPAGVLFLDKDNKITSIQSTTSAVNKLVSDPKARSLIVINDDELPLFQKGQQVNFYECVYNPFSST